jgi:hypothetical protein
MTNPKKTPGLCNLFHSSKYLVATKVVSWNLFAISESDNNLQYRESHNYGQNSICKRYNTISTNVLSNFVFKSVFAIEKIADCTT